jgi:anti-sigma28 factor (negative regulator of flagellin synthesis)
MRINLNRSPAPALPTNSPASAALAASQNDCQPDSAEADSVSNSVQLSHLSAVLNSLESGAAAATQKIASLTGLVRGGVYQVQSQLISSRIVGEALSAH